VSGNAKLPTVIDAGEMPLIVGTSALIVNVLALDVPPPGAGVTTVTETVPSVATSNAGTVAVSAVALTYVVVNAVVPHITVDWLVKPAPFTVSGKAAAPAVAVVGEIPPTVGASALTVNGLPLEVPPPGAGVTTVTKTVPSVATCNDVTCAVSSVALTNVVASAVVPHFTVDALVKFAPVTVSGNAAAPVVAVVGEIPLIVGAGGGALIVKVSAPEVPPPGGSVTTVTATPPG